MGVMTGYTLPAGVKNDTASIKAEQTRLGVTADGIWGPKTDAAYKNSSAQTASNSASPITDINHRSGYSGKGYTSGKNTYTDYGALVRDDGFFYPTGARISPNGMYYDIGKGWQFAKKALAFGPNNQIYGYQNSSMTGAAPGAEVFRVDKRKSSAPTTTMPTTPTTPTVTTPTADEIAAELQKQRRAAELAAYLNKQKGLTGY